MQTGLRNLLLHGDHHPDVHQQHQQCLAEHECLEFQIGVHDCDVGLGDPGRSDNDLGAALATAWADKIPEQDQIATCGTAGGKRGGAQLISGQHGEASPRNISRESGLALRTKAVASTQACVNRLGDCGRRNPPSEQGSVGTSGGATTPAWWYTVWPRHAGVDRTSAWTGQLSSPMAVLLHTTKA